MEGRLPKAVDEDALSELAAAHHARTARPVGVRDAAGHLVKAYVLQAPHRSVAEGEIEAALRVAAAHLELGPVRGSLGLAVVILHAGGDGDYVLVHTWIEGYMSDLALYTSPAGRPDRFRPGQAGLGPCVWEAALLAHERRAFLRHVLDADGPVADRLTAWSADTLSGDLR